ncbi:MAG: hypothetical protein K2J01_03040 [Clostridiales bacterium]|nr:hypothetical protein [Clostridiales bacterium]
MHGLQLIGEYALEIFVVSLLLALSALLVIPLIPMLVGVAGFFKNKMGVRRFKDIFTTIGSNFGIIALYTIFELIILLFSVLNLYFFNTHPANINYFVMVICYIALVVGIVYLVTGPTIIVNMQVGVRQFLYNGLVLMSGGILRSLAAIAVAGGVVAIIILYPYVLPLTLYAVPFVISKLLTENFYTLKARALKTSVYRLKHEGDKDNYLNEYGEVNHEDENQKDA